MRAHLEWNRSGLWDTIGSVSTCSHHDLQAASTLTSCHTSVCRRPCDRSPFHWWKQCLERQTLSARLWRNQHPLRQHHRPGVRSRDHGALFGREVRPAMLAGHLLVQYASHSERWRRGRIYRLGKVPRPLRRRNHMRIRAALQRLVRRDLLLLSVIRVYVILRNLGGSLLELPRTHFDLLHCPYQPMSRNYRADPKIVCPGRCPHIDARQSVPDRRFVPPKERDLLAQKFPANPRSRTRHLHGEERDRSLLQSVRLPKDILVGTRHDLLSPRSIVFARTAGTGIRIRALRSSLVHSRL